MVSARDPVLDEAARQRIADAIDVVDQQSDGEIYCLVAGRASAYREVPLLAGVALALILPALLLVFGVTPDQWLTGGWHTPGDARDDIIYALSVMGVFQAILFLMGVALASLTPLRRALTPGFLAEARVRRLAGQMFVATGIHLKKTQPHVLILVSLDEHRVEILADDAIHAITGAPVWDAARDAVITGIAGPDPAAALIRAVEIVGAPLIAHFPATPEFPDVNANGVGEI